jgi:hypothetical protein
MSERGIERRLCPRFKLPGATVSYRRMRLLHKAKGFDEQFCPVLDVNRGGVCFLTQRLMKFRSQVVLQLSVPGERIPFNLHGRVRWSSQSAATVYKYQAGIQFNPYGEGPEKNYPGTLVKIIALEQRFFDPNGPDVAGR